jgi:hypothetical protein
MPALTAVEARDLASSAYTQEELDDIFAGVDILISKAAALRQFYIDVAVGSREIALLSQWVTAAGYTLQSTPPDIPIGAPVRIDYNGTLTSVRIAWQGFEFRDQPLLTVPKNSVVQFILDTKGVDDGVELYWQNVGTALEVDFADSTNEGLITVEGNSAVIVRGVLLGAQSGGTIQIAAFLDYDGSLQQVAISQTVTIAD